MHQYYSIWIISKVPLVKVFSTQDREFYICTNYKVMYSSLMHDENFILIKNKDFFVQNLLKKIGLNKKPFYLLFRDPIRKLESFYANKIILADSFSKWEHCQEIFFEYLGISKDTSDSEKIIAFKSMNYKKFIELLPSVFLRDLHLTPQTDAMTVELEKINISMQIAYDDIFDIGNHERIDNLEKLINVTFEHKNRTNYSTTIYCYTSEMKRIVNKVYKDDLELYNNIKTIN